MKPTVKAKIHKTNTRYVPTFQSRLSRWVHSHGESAALTLKELARNPFGSLLTMSIFAVIMSLPVGLYWATMNVSHWINPWAEGGEITAFMHKGVPMLQVQEVAHRFQQDVDVAKVDIITPEEALKDFNAFSGMQDVVTALGENPLPAVLLITPKRFDTAVIDRLEQALKADQRIEQFQFDTAWVLRLQALLSLAEHATVVISVLLGAGLLLVTGHSVRTAVLARASDITIAKWVGAPDSFVRRPFLYSGFWLGAIGSVMGLVLVSISFAMVAPALNRVLESYGSQWEPQWLSWGLQLEIIALCALLGVAGAWIASTQYLYSVRPR
jgi:cell division transport system permease protein